ncbi:Uma2 family endonuclease [Leptolyngbya iicbica]|uniref:Uma2 family endonuclease n=2 Tax=Cyanophyceae TaxID=3028117 RepID=A0A4V2E2T8_9CYAN|nr:Uma2 family endonuclease [Leptolyngbya sp. LK]RZM79706.1 Uma2 family endonuclease [Leptolyngbya sp. LK]
MSPSVTLAKWTLEQYHQMIAAGILDDQPVELLNGEIVEMAPEGPEHAQISTDAADYLRAILGSRALVREAKPITLSTTHSEPEPDIAIVEPLRGIYRTRHPYPENIFWLIEYANTSFKKDTDPKAQVYAAAGIPEYWVVNLKKMELLVMRHPQQNQYSSVTILTAGTISPLAFPDRTISVSQLLD